MMQVVTKFGAAWWLLSATCGAAKPFRYADSATGATYLRKKLIKAKIVSYTPTFRDKSHQSHQLQGFGRYLCGNLLVLVASQVAPNYLASNCEQSASNYKRGSIVSLGKPIDKKALVRDMRGQVMPPGKLFWVEGEPLAPEPDTDRDEILRKALTYLSEHNVPYVPLDIEDDIQASYEDDALEDFRETVRGWIKELVRGVA